MRTRLSIFFTLVLMLGLGAACDTGEMTEPEVVTIQAAASVPDSVMVAEAVDLSVVVERDGSAAAGEVVTWAVDSGGGTVSSGTSTTDGSGVARTTWTLGTTAGENNRVIARVDDAESDAEFTAVPVAGPVSELTVTPAAVELTALEDTARLEAAAVDAWDNPAGEVSWSTTGGVVSVTDGVVMALAEGTATVVAAAGSLADTVTVTVEQVAASVVASVDDSVLTALGDTVVATAVVADANGHAMADTVVWSSLASGVATVGADGVIEAIANGEADIVAASGDLADTLAITVVQEAATVTVSPAETTLSAVGDTTTLTAAVADANGAAMASSATWQSLDTGVVTVDASGLVTAVAGGSTQVVATAGEVADTADVAVALDPADVVVAPTSVTMTALGDTAILTGSVVDASGTEIPGAEATWSTLDETVATVAGGTVTAVSAGQTDVVATYEGLADTAAILVDPVPTSLVVTPEQDTIRSVGGSAQLWARMQDANGHDVAGATVTWSSLDESVATVDADGLVTAVATGETQVVATNDVLADTALMVVVQTVADIDITQDAVRLESLGETAVLDVTVVDASGSSLDATVQWTARDPSVVTLSDSIVTAAANGATWVVASAGEVADSVNVRVEQVAVSFSATVPRDTVNALGATVQAEAVGTDANLNPLSGVPVSWQSLTPTVASVSTDGVITALSRGDARVTATQAGMTDTVAVHVRQVVATVSVSPNESALYLGESRQLTATAYDSLNAIVADAVPTWSTSDAAVATVSSQGLVTTVGTGTATISATADGQTGAASVNVTELPVGYVLPGDSISGTLASGTDTAVYTFDAEAGDLFNLFGRRVSGTEDVRFYVYEHYGTWDQQQVAYVRARSSTGDLRSYYSGRFAIDRAGTYTVEVTSAAAASHQFQLFPIDRSPETRSATFAVGDTVGGTIDPYGDVDTYTFSGGAGQEVNFFLRKIEGASLQDVYLYVYRHYGTVDQVELDRVSTAHKYDLRATYTGRVVLPASDVYTVEISGDAGQLGAYEFEAFPIDRSAESGITSVAMSDTTVGEIAPVEDIDEYTFQAQEGQELVIFFQGLTGYWDDRFYLNLYRRYGSLDQELVESISSYGDALNCGLRCDHTQRLTIPESETYTIVVNGRSRDSGFYRFELFEPNDAPETHAAAVAAGDTVRGTIDPAYDADVYTFTAEAGDELALFGQGLTGSSGDHFMFEVYQNYGSPDQARMADFYGVGNQASLRDRWSGRLTVPETGEYQVVVTGAYGDIGDYRFELFPVDRTPETAASQVAVGDTTLESIEPLGDVDEFAFDGTQGQTVEVLFQALSGDSGDYLRLRVLLPDGSELGVVTSSGYNDTLTGQTTGALTLPTTGTYTIEVAGYSDAAGSDDDGGYRFTVQEPAP